MSIDFLLFFVVLFFIHVRRRRLVHLQLLMTTFDTLVLT